MSLSGVKNYKYLNTISDKVSARFVESLKGVRVQGNNRRRLRTIGHVDNLTR